MSKEAYAKAQEIKAANPDLFPPQDKSLAWKITDSSLYDWNPTARFLLTQLAVLSSERGQQLIRKTRRTTSKPTKKGWCWMTQAKLALKVGVHDSTIYRWIKRFREDGVIKYRDWRDDNTTMHAEYKVVESVIDANQRPSQRADVERPPRYKEGSRKGTAKKQARGKGGTFMKVVEDDE